MKPQEIIKWARQNKEMIKGMLSPISTTASALDKEWEQRIIYQSYMRALQPLPVYKKESRYNRFAR